VETIHYIYRVFLKGLLAVLPVAVTVYLPRSSVEKLDLGREEALRLAITAGVGAENRQPGDKSPGTVE